MSRSALVFGLNLIGSPKLHFWKAILGPFRSNTMSPYSFSFLNSLTFFEPNTSPNCHLYVKTLRDGQTVPPFLFCFSSRRQTLRDDSVNSSMEPSSLLWRNGLSYYGCQRFSFGVFLPSTLCSLVLRRLYCARCCWHRAGTVLHSTSFLTASASLRRPLAVYVTSAALLSLNLAVASPWSGFAIDAQVKMATRTDQRFSSSLCGLVGPTPTTALHSLLSMVVP